MEQSKVKLLAIGSLATCLVVVALVILMRGNRETIVTSRDRVDGTSVQYDVGPDGKRIVRPSNRSRNGGENRSDPELTANPSAGLTADSGGSKSTPAKGDDTTTGTTTAGSAGGLNGSGLSGGPDGAGGTLAGGTTGPGGGSGRSADGTGVNSSGTGNSTGLDGNSADNANSEEDEPEEDEVLIGGRVLRGESPIADAYITLTHVGGVLSERTNEDGAYRFSPVKAGDLMLFLQDPPSPQPRRRLSLQPGEHRLAEDFVIPASPPVKGEVLDADSGERIADAEVKVLQGDRLIGSVRTDSAGAFTLFPLDPGIYRAEGHVTGYLPGDKAFEVFETKETPTVFVELSSSRVAAGQVIAANGSPVSGAYVALFGAWAYSDPFSSIGTVVTDGAGRFRFAIPNDPTLTEFRVGAYKQEMTPGFSATYNATTIPPEENIIVQLPQGATITGRVLESEEYLIDGAEIAVREGYATTGVIHQRFNVAHEQRTYSGTDGRFTLTGVEAGTTKLNFAAEGYISQEKVVELAEGQTLDLGDVTMEGEDGARPGRIFGVIVDERGNAMRDHAVLVRGTSGRQESVRSDSRGNFKFDGLPDGDYAIFTNGSLLRGEIFIVVDQTNPFVRPGDDRVYLVYDMGQAARMRVSNASGRAVTAFRAGVRIRQNGPQGSGGVSETFGQGFEFLYQTSNGELTMENLIAGNADFTISIEGEGTAEVKNVVVPVGGTVELGDIVIGSGATATGQVVNAVDGSSVSGMRVSVVAPENAAPNHPLNVIPHESQTGTDGRFLIGGLPVGSADIVIRKSGFVTQRLRNIEIAAGSPNDMGTIQAVASAVLQGRVTDGAGKALSDIQITAGSEVVFTDRDGRYYVDTISPGTVTIVAYDHNGRYARATSQANLTAGQATVADLAMSPVSP